MDPITHSLTGLTLSNLGLREVAPLASTAVLLSSILPDVDYLTNLKGREAYLKHHRGLSHSILGIAILCRRTTS
ncbi:MAG: metal-dependent hydrolase [candidate division NC10 bacterium]|nr:metal-dependent hydrolase [candidate division NC10 bacterium]